MQLHLAIYERMCYNKCKNGGDGFGTENMSRGCDIRVQRRRGNPAVAVSDGRDPPASAD